MASNPSYYSFLLTYVALLFLILSSHFIRIDAEKHKHKSPPPPSDDDTPPPPSDYTSPPPPHKKNKKHKSPPPPPSEDTPPSPSEDTPPPPPPSPSDEPNTTPPGASQTFNVQDYQQSGEDWGPAFQGAWAAACPIGTGAVVLVPKGSTFLVKPTVFDGQKCQSGITFQVDGIIQAPEAIGDWKEENNNWLNFNQANGLQILGGGTIDGRGHNWWTKKQKPTALRIGSSDAVSVSGITLRNSPQAHLKFDFCTHSKAFGITIKSPQNSSNTDGIHIGRSKGIDIRDMMISCGDDCISMGSGNENIKIDNITCDPSHGMSIGSLGEDDGVACVTGISVTNSIIRNSLTGARIKCFTGGQGMVSAVSFSNLQLENVEVALKIDQFYQSSTSGEGSGVLIQDVIFENIKGTYSSLPASLMCGTKKPCLGITLSDISLESTTGVNTNAKCQHVSVIFKGKNSKEIKSCSNSGTSSDWWNYHYNAYVDSATESCSS